MSYVWLFTGYLEIMKMYTPLLKYLTFNQAQPTDSLHATHYISNTDYIINTEHYIESNHLSPHYSFLAWGSTWQQLRNLLINEWCLAVDRRTHHIHLIWKIQWKIRPFAYIIQHKSNKMTVVSISQCYLFAVLKEKASVFPNEVSQKEQQKG